MNHKDNSKGKFCPRCGQLLYNDYDDLACLWCGYREYPWEISEDRDYSQWNDKTREKFYQTILNSPKWKAARERQKKVPETEYQAIYDRQLAGENIKVIARDYNVAASSIYRIVGKSPNRKDGRFKANGMSKKGIDIIQS